MCDWACSQIADVIRSYLSPLLNGKAAFAARLSCKSWHSSVLHPSFSLLFPLAEQTRSPHPKALLHVRSLTLTDFSEADGQILLQADGLFSSSSPLRHLLIHGIEAAGLALLAREMKQSRPALKSVRFISNLEPSNFSNFLEALQSCQTLEKIDFSCRDLFEVVSSSSASTNSFAQLILSLPNLETLILRRNRAGTSDRWLDVARAIVARGSITDLAFRYERDVRFPDGPTAAWALEDRLAQVLQGCSSLTSLELFNIGYRESTSYFDCIRNLTSLKSLRCPSEPALLSRALTRAHSHLTHMDLSCLEVDPIPYLGAVLHQLTTINLCDMILSTAGADLLAACVRSSTCLKNLVLSGLTGADHGDRGASEIICSLSQAPSSLQKVEIDVAFEGDAAIELAALLRRSDCGVRCLRLSIMPLSAECSKAMGESLCLNTSLRHLRLPAKVTEGFLNSLAKNRTIEKLDLSLPPAHTLVLCAFVELNTRLQQLDLVRSCFDDESLSQLLRTVTGSPSLKSLRLSCSKIGALAFPATVSLIEQNRVLRHLSMALKGSWLSESCLIVLLKSIQLNEVLTSVFLPRRDPGDGAASREYLDLRVDASIFKKVLVNFA